MSRLAPGMVAALLVVTAACSRNPQYYLDKANKLAAGGKPDDAVLIYRKAIQADPNFGEAYYQMGVTLWRLHRTQEAYAALLQAVQTMPNREDAKVKLADLELSSYLSDSRRPTVLHDRIQELANRILAADAESYDGLRIKGHLAASDRHWSEAEALYAHADRIKPMQPELILGWTQVLFEDGQAKQAEQQAFQLIATQKTYGPIYDVLYRHYMAAKQLADAGNILKLKVANNPTDAASHLELAAFYAESSRESDMQAVLRGMLDDPKTFPDAPLQVGDLYARMQRWDDALRLYDQGAKAGSKQRVTYLRKIADVWLARGKGEQANQVVDEILKEAPKDPSARAVKASLLLSTGKRENVDKAAAELKSLVDADPTNAVLRFNLGRALAAKGDLDGARVQFQESVNHRRSFLPPRLALLELAQARRDYKASLQYADEILAIYPALMRIKLVHAASLMYVGKDAQARAEFAALEKSFPNDPELQMQLAVMKLHEKKYQEAEEHFRKMVEKRGSDPRAMNGLVETLTAENQPDKAIAALQDELKKDPGSIPVRSLLARTAAMVGKYDVAIDQYRQLLAMAPESEAICLALGTTYRMKGDFANSVVYLQKARTLAPKDPVPMVRLGGALALSGHQPEALALYRDVLKVRQDDASTWNNAAYLIAETGGNLDEAMKFAQKAMQLDSHQPHYADTLGWVYLKKRLDDSAIQVFRGLTDKYPNDATFHYHFGLALLQHGDKETARTELKTALTKQPSDEVRRNIETALAKLG